MCVSREAFRYNFQFLILTLAVRIWVPAERKRIIATLGLKPGDKVLDHCCGLGGNLSPLCAAIAPGGSVEAMDHSPDMIEASTRLAKRRRLPVTVVQADAMQLPYPDETFDGVMHTGAINQFGDQRQKAMDEILRVTKPGGVIAIQDEGMSEEMTHTRFGKFLIKQNAMFLDPIPTELVPDGVEATVGRVMAGLFYNIVFRKPEIGGQKPEVGDQQPGA
ncbi:MAG: methyltransferase domain-containing protein [Kiritimatiellae bacterium]|nr:methyltransferase domain-containing protein [Kiritimatiellia bacterium]